MDAQKYLSQTMVLMVLPWTRSVCTRLWLHACDKQPPLSPQQWGGWTGCQNYKVSLRERGRFLQSSFGLQGHSIVVWELPSATTDGEENQNTSPSDTRVATTTAAWFREIQQKNTMLKLQQQQTFNRRHHTRTLPPLQTGQQVWIKPTRIRGTVVDLTHAPRSYEVEILVGGRLPRNHPHLSEVPVPPTSGDVTILGQESFLRLLRDWTFELWTSICTMEDKKEKNISRDVQKRKKRPQFSVWKVKCLLEKPCSDFF